MIVKIVSQPANQRGARGLARYMVGKLADALPSAWHRAVAYAAGSERAAGSVSVPINAVSKDGTRVAAVRVTNCGTDRPEAAVAAILVTEAQHQERARHSSKSPIMHLIFSFPPGERPDLATLGAIENKLVQAIGMEAHQRISAVHDDKDHLHVHVLINHIHPTSLNFIKQSFDYPKLRAASVQIERDYSLTLTKAVRSVDGTQPVPDAARQIEARSQRDSFARWAQDNLAQPLLAAAKVAGATWTRFHRTAAAHGVEAKLRGSGLVFASIEHPTMRVKASTVDRGLSLEALQSRMGTFERSRVPNPQQSLNPSATRPGYQPQPPTDSNRLWAEYNVAKNLAAEARQTALDQTKGEKLRKLSELEEWRKDRVRSIGKATGLARMEAAKANEAAKYRRFEINHSFDISHKAQPADNFARWPDWLQQRGREGDTAAIHLRQKMFADWVSKTAESELQGVARAGEGWRALHEKAAAFGLTIEAAINGLRIVSRTDPSLTAGLSADLKTHASAIGPYTPPHQAIATTAAREAFGRAPGVFAPDLEQQYQQERRNRDIAQLELKAERRDGIHAITTWRNERIIGFLRQGGFDFPTVAAQTKATEATSLATLDAQLASREAALAGQINRQDWLMVQVMKGNEAALAELRAGRAQGAARRTTSTVTIQGDRTGANRLHPDIKPSQVFADGTVHYETDRGSIYDRPGWIDIYTTPQGHQVVDAARALAGARWPGERIQVVTLTPEVLTPQQERQNSRGMER